VRAHTHTHTQLQIGALSSKINNQQEKFTVLLIISRFKHYKLSIIMKHSVLTASAYS